jgi:hypothetical protein
LERSPRSQEEALVKAIALEKPNHARELSAGHNWLDGLAHFADISGILAGFSVAFIALIMGGQVANVGICTSGVTFGQLSVLLFGSSSIFFIFASQRFLHAHEYNVWDLPEEYIRLTLDDLKSAQPKKWDEFLLENDSTCRKYEKEGRYSYDFAILLMIGGLFFMIVPYSLVAAILVFTLGALLETLQYLR